MAVVQVRLLDLDIQRVQPAVDPTTNNISSGEPWQITKWNQPSSYETFGKLEPSFSEPDLCPRSLGQSGIYMCRAPNHSPFQSVCALQNAKVTHGLLSWQVVGKPWAMHWSLRRAKVGIFEKVQQIQAWKLYFGFLWMSQELAISCQAADAQHVNFVVHLSYCLKSPPGLQRTFIATLQICLAPSQDA